MGDNFKDFQCPIEIFSPECRDFKHLQFALAICTAKKEGILANFGLNFMVTSALDILSVLKTNYSELMNSLVVRLPYQKGGYKKSKQRIQDVQKLLFRISAAFKVLRKIVNFCDNYMICHVDPAELIPYKDDMETFEITLANFKRTFPVECTLSEVMQEKNELVEEVKRYNDHILELIHMERSIIGDVNAMLSMSKECKCEEPDNTK